MKLGCRSKRKKVKIFRRSSGMVAKGETQESIEGGYPGPYENKE